MAKSERKFNSRGQRQNIVWKLDDMAGLVKGDLLAFAIKANSVRPSIIRPLPEIDGGVIQPIRLSEDPEDPQPTCFFDKVTIAEIGSGKEYKQFIADPSDAALDTPRSDYPVMMLRKMLEDAINAGEPWAMPHSKWFIPKGKYKSIDFPWPLQYTAIQVVAYQQPGCNVEKTQMDAPARLQKHPTLGWMLANPEFKVALFKSGGVSELETLFFNADDDGNFPVPANVFDPKMPIALYCSGEMEKTEDGEFTRSKIAPFNLQENAFYVPNEEDIRKFVKPWSEVWYKRTFDEQVNLLLQSFGPDVINRCFGNLNGPAHTQDPAAGAVVGGGQPAADPAAGAGGWSAGPVDQPAGQPAQPAGGIANPAGEAAPQGGIAQPASGGQTGIADASAGAQADVPTGAMSPDDMSKRFASWGADNAAEGEAEEGAAEG